MNSMLTALADRRMFVMYRLVPLANGKTDKVPTDPLTGLNSNAQDPATWMLPHEAEAWAQALGAPYGYGIVIHEGCGLFVVDIDGALIDGEWSELARAFCVRFDGCAIEVSVSGTGLHIFGTVTGEPLPHKTKNIPLHIEYYTAGRFIALTGTGLVGDVRHDCTALLPAFTAQYFAKTEEDANPADWRSGPMPGYNGPADDATLIERALKSKSMAAVFGGGVSFADLWLGNDAKLSTKWPSATGGKYDESSADQAMANHLAFWTGNDCDRMLRLMADSALARDKWEQRSDYLPRTILRACSWQKTFAGPTGAAKAVAAPAAPAYALHAPPAPQTAPPPPALIAPPPPAADGTPAFSVPPIPDSVQHAPAATARGEIVGVQGQEELFTGYHYVEDIFAAMTPEGYTLDKSQFDIRFGGRIYLVTRTGERPTDSAWECFTKSQTAEFSKVRGMYFEPREEAGAIIVKEGERFINSWKPIHIRAEPGDVSLFRSHVRKLFPAGDDAVILESYLKFMVQHKGVKAMWWPFLQGIPGNGKSFISATMQYCIGEKYTQNPTAAHIASNFNAWLYGCLFVAIEDVFISEAKGSMWETIKPMITQTRLEIERKGVDKVTREVCFNGILNSNHKNGVRKTADDRRIAPFFAAQQVPGDLQRDGLTAEYFRTLWNWAKADGWAYVAHWLATDAIDARFDPTNCTTAPETSSTRAAIAAGMGSAEQDLMEAVYSGLDGFRGGWINSIRFDVLLAAHGKARAIPRNKRAEMLLGLGYIPHPGLPDGRVTTPLTDSSRPVLYVRQDHTTLALTDANAIKALYEAAQKPK